MSYADINDRARADAKDVHNDISAEMKARLAAAVKSEDLKKSKQEQAEAR